MTAEPKPYTGSCDMCQSRITTMNLDDMKLWIDFHLNCVELHG